MWIMVEPVAKIPFRIHQSPTRYYRCNRNYTTAIINDMQVFNGGLCNMPYNILVLIHNNMLLQDRAYSGVVTPPIVLSPCSMAHSLGNYLQSKITETHYSSLVRKSNRINYVTSISQTNELLLTSWSKPVSESWITKCHCCTTIKHIYYVFLSEHKSQDHCFISIIINAI
jgi:hypothetical protein